MPAGGGTCRQGPARGEPLRRGTFPPPGVPFQFRTDPASSARRQGVPPACNHPPPRVPGAEEGSRRSLLSRVMRKILWIMWLMLSCSHSSRCERKERLISATE